MTFVQRIVHYRPFGIRNALLGAAIVSSLASSAAVAEAASACVPPPGGIIGIPGPPDWTTGGTPAIDDPRWHGATRETFPDTLSAGTPDSVSRLVQTGTSLFFQLETLADATPGNTTVVAPDTFYRDSIYIGFATTDLATINIVRVAIDPTQTPPTRVTRWQKSGGVWSSPIGLPGWFAAHTAWVSSTVSGVVVPWAVDVRVDTSAIPGPKIWYATSISPGAFGTIHAYGWPDRGGFIEPNPPNPALPPGTWGTQFDAIGLSNWGDYTPVTGVPPLPAGCAGVRIESDDIGTTNTPSWKINNNASNTFRAQLSVTGGASMPAANTVRGRFRLANWGMQIGQNGTWDDIPGGAYVNDLKNNAAGLITFTCPYVGPASCPPLAAGSTTDQCMLVELQPAAGPVTFSKDSAWHNMIFGPASKFEHDAEISLAGLPPEPTPRDIYIYVQAHNMPAKVDPQQPPGQTTNDQRKTDDPAQKYKFEGMNATERRVMLGGPTYEVRGYRDTGKGAPGWQALEPMVPFGYLMEHNGPLIGWTEELVGVGTTVTTIIPNVLYKISVVPGQKVTVKTRIEALEPGSTVPPVKPCPHCCCDIARRDNSPAYLAIAALAAMVAVGRRRRRS